jgi:hypothetical protein
MNYVVCLKWGTKYGPEYVNRLANMVSRNTTVDYEFVCFTENSSGLDKNIKIKPLPKYPLTGWWYKPYFLSSDVPLKGTLLFLDLDIVVFKNIDKLFDYEPGKFCIVRDFNRNTRKNFDYMNSSVFRVESGQYHNIWKDFIKNSKSHVSRNRGDQDWMQKNIKDHVYWPDEWIQSYKWEMRSRADLTVVNGKRNFKDDKPPQMLPGTSIAVFHGMPNPEECNDKWVKKHWV